MTAMQQKEKFHKYCPNYYVIYTVCFGILCLGVYSWFLCGHRTFIWHADGWNQHYKALVYYAQYLREIIRSFLSEGGLVIPNWDFALGEGGDVLQTLHYYVVGEPLMVLSALVPAKYLYVFYDLCIIIRLYLAGISFSWFCRKVGNRSKYAVLAGAMTYIFCYWAIYYSVMHPYFLTPMIYLPLLLLGVEKIIQKESPLFLSVMVFLSSITNLYFFYMLVLIVVLYVMARLILLYKKDVKRMGAMICRIGAASILGGGMSAIVFAPMCYTFLNNSRLGSADGLANLFYPLSYYSKFAGMFLAKGMAFDLCMGFSVPALLALFLLFKKKKKYTLLKVLFLGGSVMMVLPIFGQIFNGFSYKSNRWCFALALLISYVLTAMWPYMMKMSKVEMKYLFLCLSVYYVLCLFMDYSRNISVFTAICLGYVFLGLIALLRQINVDFSWGGG